MKFAVLCYDFPHWKTQTGLLALYVNGLVPDIVVAAPWVNVDIEPSSISIVQKGLYLMPTERICKRLGLNYVSLPHEEYKGDCDFAVILGARILSKDLIARFPRGIINIHPGILPYNRGLDNVKWAVLKDLPQGVTAHFINEMVDSGTVIDKVEVPIYHDDSLSDIQFRVQNKEIEVLVDVVRKVKDGAKGYERIAKDSKTQKCMNKREELEMLDSFPYYKIRWGK